MLATCSARAGFFVRAAAITTQVTGLRSQLRHVPRLIAILIGDACAIQEQPRIRESRITLERRPDRVLRVPAWTSFRTQNVSQSYQVTLFIKRAERFRQRIAGHLWRGFGPNRMRHCVYSRYATGKSHLGIDV
jgi:hypothetical protein